jgi:hypothetical protein
MDETWRHMAWIVGSGGFGAALGAVFGAVTGAVYWGSGGAAGTAMGHRVAAAFENAGGREMSARTRGTLVGATDGFLFLGPLGTAAGVVFAYVGRPEDAVLIALAVGGVLLAAGAAGFGVLAYAMVRNGVWAVIGMFVGGLGGAFVVAAVWGVAYVFLGLVPGMLAGTLASFALRKYEPRFRGVRVARPAFEKWRTDGPDLIQKAQPSDE